MLNENNALKNIEKTSAIFAYILVPFTFYVIVRDGFSNLKYSNEFSIGGVSFVMISLQFIQVSTHTGRARSLLITICIIGWLILSFISITSDKPDFSQPKQQSERLK